LSTYTLPFIPQSSNFDAKTLSLNATHPGPVLSSPSSLEDGTFPRIDFYAEYNVHNLFGHMHGRTTKELLPPGKNLR